MIEPAGADRAALLVVRDLTVDFVSPEGRTRAVDGISFEVGAGETLGVVGESGSGKTVTFLSLLGLLPQPAGRVTSGTALLGGRDLLTMPAADLRAICGRDVGVVFQDPMTSLNPVFSVGSQLLETLRVHQAGLKRSAARRRAVELLDRVGVPDAAQRVGQYPHQFSGGMRQRAMIAMAIGNDPRLIVADEPTTALDVTIQAQVLALLAALRRETGAAMVLITHDLGLVAEQADRVVVMYAGQVMEVGPAGELFATPRHPYTAGLLASIPSLHARGQRLRSMPGMAQAVAPGQRGCPFRDRCPLSNGRERCSAETPPLVEVSPGRRSACHFQQEMADGRDIWAPAAAAVPGRAGPVAVPAGGAAGAEVLRVEHLVKHFPVHRGLLRRVVGRVRAVDDVSFTLARGETLGLVGESGSGKSTVGRAIMRFLRPTSGDIRLQGRDIGRLGDRQLRPLRSGLQIVFQDPHASLDPRMTVRQVVAEPLEIHGFPRSAIGPKVLDLLARVGLDPRRADRYPHEFSGGQRQRIAIARALALDPSLIVFDEPVSSLDVSIQAQVISLLEDLQVERGLAYVFISHDLSVVGHIADRVAVMYLGRIVEIGPTEQVFRHPNHPYTQALLSAVPAPDVGRRGQAARIVLRGEVPSSLAPPSGCRFRTRCWRAREICAVEDPALMDRTGAGHPDACHFSGPLEAAELAAASSRVGGVDT